MTLWQSMANGGATWGAGGPPTLHNKKADRAETLTAKPYRPPGEAADVLSGAPAQTPPLPPSRRLGAPDPHTQNP